MAKKCEFGKQNGERCGADAQTGNSLLPVSRWPQLTLSLGNRSTRAVVDYNKILREEQNEEEPQLFAACWTAKTTGPGTPT